MNSSVTHEAGRYPLNVKECQEREDQYVWKLLFQDHGNRLFDGTDALHPGISKLNKAMAVRQKNRPKSRSLMPCRCTVPGCGKEFSKRSNLKAHLRVHSDVLPYPCMFPNCNKRFRWKSSLKPHIKVHQRGRVKNRKHTSPNGTEIKPRSPSRVYECPRPGCGARFGRVSLLEKHELRSHCAEGDEEYEQEPLVMAGIIPPEYNSAVTCANRELSSHTKREMNRAIKDEPRKESWNIDLSAVDDVDFEDFDFMLPYDISSRSQSLFGGLIGSDSASHMHSVSAL